MMNFRITLIFSSTLILLSSCGFYRIKTVPVDYVLEREIQDPNKYVILHHEDTAVHLNYLSNNESGDFVSKMVTEVGERHKLYQWGFDGERFANVKKEERSRKKERKHANNPNKIRTRDTTFFFLRKNGMPYQEIHLYANSIEIDKNVYPEIYTVKKAEIDKAIVYSRENRKSLLLWLIPLIVGAPSLLLMVIWYGYGL